VAAILAMASIAGQQAPPVNVPIMIICTSVFMPYEGFMAPLALLNFRWGSSPSSSSGGNTSPWNGWRRSPRSRRTPICRRNSFKLYFPALLLAVLLSGPRLVHGWPDVSTRSPSSS
jgi:hypothetical protein